jgi:hypothetical protein
MKFQVIFRFFVVSIVSWSVFAASIPSALYQLTLIETELGNSQPLFPYLIKLFSTLKIFYNRFESLLSGSDYESGFGTDDEVHNSDHDDESHHSDSYNEPIHLTIYHSVLLKYYSLVQTFYNNSPLEALRAVRLYGNFEFAHLFTDYIINMNSSPCLDYLRSPFCKILEYKEMKRKFKKRNFNILNNYELFGMNILLEPFKASLQTQSNNAEDMTAQNSSYVVEWEERKEILEEIIHSIKSLNIFARHLSADVSMFLIKIKRKVEKFELVVKSFRVDSQGPSLDHFVSIFYQLQSLVKDFKFYKDLPLSTKNLFSLFGIYRYHLIENQSTDPLLFPQKMLAVVSHEDSKKKNFIFKLLKLPIDLPVQKVLKSFQRCQIYDILHDDHPGGLISEIYDIEMDIFDAVFDLGKGLWHNLLNLQNVLSPREQRIVKTYLALQNKKS